MGLVCNLGCLPKSCSDIVFGYLPDSPRRSCSSSDRHRRKDGLVKKKLLSGAGAGASPSTGGLWLSVASSQKYNRQIPVGFRISNLASTSANPPGSQQLTTTRGNNDKSNASSALLGKSSSSAMEQLDFERGVCVPFRKYSPETVRNKVLESRGAILSLLGRGVEIVWNLGFYWSTLMYDFLVGRDEEVVPFRARQLRNLLCDLGPSFIKAGQVLANRPDIIREDYMNELCILQDDVPPFPNQVAFTIIEEELGQPLEAVFTKISSQTIAAASLGQVYRATLLDTGEDVAIKVE